ncbi:peptidase domain-containing ABC transporter [Streptomyces sp. NPDC085524]|uniref:peptidase domain-containing ABC transporter n=1 Tax=unclassified Streptomyces TaxID=2593676 RepID=UPI0035DBF388
MAVRTRRARRVREVQQFAQSECGLCCIAMILSAYGSRDSVAALRREHEVGRDGLTIKEIATILRGRGFRVRAFRAGADRLDQLALPLIAYWDDSHVVVVEEITDRHVVVVDPGGGRRKYEVAEFEQHYSGLALEATPTEDHQPVRHREPSVWREFFRSLSGARRPLLQAFLMSLVLYSFTVFMPIATQYAVNDYAGYLEKAPIVLVLVAFTVPMAVFFVLSLLRTVCLAAVIRGLGEAMMGKTFKKLLDLPYKYFANRSQGELFYRLSSIASVRDMISSQVSIVLLDLGSVIAIFSYMFYRSLTLGAAAFAVFLVMLVVAVSTYRPIRRITEREISETAKSSSIQMEALGSIETLKVSGMTDTFFRDWKKVYSAGMEQTQRRIVLQGVAAGGYSVFQVFGPLLVLAVGLWLVLHGSLDLGSAVAAQTLTATSLGMVMSLSGAFTQLITANAQVARVGDILHQPESKGAFGDRPAVMRGAVSLREVTFAYPGVQSPALDGISFDVRPGERVAIVGSSGSGKSTLGKLLMGLYPLQSGDVVYDGVSIGEIDADTFYEGAAYVPQDIVLSNRSIAENIRFGVPDATMEAVDAAARQAHVHEDIAAMPLGYHTPVREMGGSLSGGQRQRIALARALVRRPKVLVLDEATSALDTVTESRIAAALDRLECTRIIIAHRLSTIVNADLVVVLEQGRVVQTGRHDELIAEPGPYRELIRSQVDLTAA